MRRSMAPLVLAVPAAAVMFVHSVPVGGSDLALEAAWAPGWPSRSPPQRRGSGHRPVSVVHHITGSSAWVAALVIMALADVLTRLVVIYLRGHRLAACSAATRIRQAPAPDLDSWLPLRRSPRQITSDAAPPVREAGVRRIVWP